MDGEGETHCGTFDFEGKEFTVKRGDYAPLMKKVSHYLEKAQVRGGVVVVVCVWKGVWVVDHMDPRLLPLYRETLELSQAHQQQEETLRIKLIRDMYNKLITVELLLNYGISPPTVSRIQGCVETM